MQKEKKKKEQYSRSFEITRGAYDLDPENEIDKVLLLVNADITSIVFACAVAKGFTSVDLRQIDQKKMRGGWRRIVFNCGLKEWVEICQLGALQSAFDNTTDPEKVSLSYSFEWRQS